MLKRAFCFLFIIFTFVNIIPLHADTISMQWMNEDDTTYDTTTCNAGDDVILPTTPTKRGYTFMGWLAYTPIEYLESTGTQYIDTGIIRTDISKIDIVIQIAPNMINADQKLFGSSYAYVGANVYFSTYNGYYRSTSIPVSDSVTSIQITRDPSFSAVVSYDDNVFTASSWWVPSGTMQTFPIFAGYQNDNTIAKSKYKCFQLKLWDSNNTLIRDMIPALDTDNIPCMFDKVSKTFFYNSGTGNFIAGPVINE